MIVAMLDFSEFARYTELWHSNGRSDETLLDVFLGQVAQVKGVDNFLFVHTKTCYYLKERIEAKLGVKVLPLRVQDGKNIYFYTSHDRIRKARLWAYNSIRGGLNDATIYDELMPMLLIRHVANHMLTRGLLHLHPCMPLFDPGYASDLCTIARGEPLHANPPMIFRQSMPGACPALVTEAGLNALKSGINWAPFHVIRGDAIGDGLMNMAHWIPHDMTNDILRERLTLFSRRDAQRIRNIISLSRGSNLNVATYARVFDLYQNVLCEPFPLEVDFAIDTSRLYAEEADCIHKVIKECCDFGDCRLTIDLRSELGQVYGPKWSTLCHALKDSRPYAVQFLASASKMVGFGIMPASLCNYCDVLNVLLDVEPEKFAGELRAWSEETRSKIHVELPFNPENWQRIHEVHKWHVDYGISYNWLPDTSKNLYAPMRRGICEKRRYQMFIDNDMMVPMCKMANDPLVRYGDASIEPLKKIWDRLCSSHGLAQCTACKNWTTT